MEQDCSAKTFSAIWSSFILRERYGPFQRAVFTFLMSTLSGTLGHTALIRGVIVAVIAMVVSRILLKPVVDVVLDAMARDRATGEDER